MRTKALLLLLLLTVLTTAGFTGSVLARPRPHVEAQVVKNSDMPPKSAMAVVPEVTATPVPTTTPMATAAVDPTPSPSPVAIPAADPTPAPQPAQTSAAAPAPAANRWVGYYMPGVPDETTALTKMDKQVGARATVVNFFIADSEQFPEPRCANAAAAGVTPLVTLEFWSIKSNGGLSAILDGSDDAYLKRFAQAAKAYGKTVWLRPFHEMNGGWYPWGATGSNTPAKLIAAYRHVHDIFEDAGANNVKFVWCPNVDFNIASYYPGDDYVDYAAIDGYNTGAPWRSFSKVFAATYAKVAALTPKPIFIAETACAPDNRKAAWISDMFAQIATAYPRLTGVCWFNVDKEHDWRVASSASSLHAFTAGVEKGF